MEKQYYHRVAALIWLAIALECKILHIDVCYWIAYFACSVNTVLALIGVFSKDTGTDAVAPTVTRTVVTDKYGDTTVSETTVTKGMVSK